MSPVLVILRLGSCADSETAHRRAHSDAKILHRDISPGNIMITNEGNGLLVDWDLSKDIGASNIESPPERTVWIKPFLLLSDAYDAIIGYLAIHGRAAPDATKTKPRPQLH